MYFFDIFIFLIYFKRGLRTSTFTIKKADPFLEILKIKIINENNIFFNLKNITTTVLSLNL